MSDRESLPDNHPLTQLSHLVRHLGEELAGFRKRALAAEARLRSYESNSRSGDLFAPQRVEELERENAELQTRLAFATERTRAILSQVRFLRQQTDRPVTGSQPVVANGDHGKAARRDRGAPDTR